MKESINDIPYIIKVPKTFAEFDSELSQYNSVQALIYLKRMRDYNSYIADASKREIYIQLNKFILQKYDLIIKKMKYDNLSESIQMLDMLYKHLHELTSDLPDIYLDYIRNKLNAYMALINKFNDQDTDNKVLPYVFQKDIFFFTKTVLRILDLKRNPRVIQTILLVLESLISKIEINQFSDACFMLSISSLLLESVWNKPEFRGKYLSCVLSSVKKWKEFSQWISLPKSKSDESISFNLIELFLYEKHDKSSHTSFVKALDYVIKWLLKLYSNSQYAEYILSFTGLDKQINKSALQLQKVQVRPLNSLAPEKLTENKEEKEEKKLKKEYKKAYRYDYFRFILSF